MKPATSLGLLVAAIQLEMGEILLQSFPCVFMIWVIGLVHINILYFFLKYTIRFLV